MKTEQIAFKSAGAVAVVQLRVGRKQPAITSVQCASLVKVAEKKGLSDDRKAA